MSEYLKGAVPDVDLNIDLPKAKKWRVELEFIWEGDLEFAPDDLRIGIPGDGVRVTGPANWHVLHDFRFKVKDPDTGVTLYEVDLSAKDDWAPYP